MRTKRRMLIFTIVNILTILVTLVVSEELARMQTAGAATIDRDLSVIEESTKNQQEALEIFNLEALEQSRIEKRKDQLEVNSVAVTEYLAEQKISNNYAINFVDLRNPEIKFEYNQAKTFAPASIYKVPLAMVVLKDVQAEKLKLSDLVRVNNKNYSIKECIRMLLADSANDSITPLENKIGGYTKAKERYRAELNINIDRAKQTVTSADVSKVFAQLYDMKNSSYLNLENRQLILDFLQTAAPRNRNRIPAAVAEYSIEKNLEGGITAATKIGNLNGVYQDAGIIFGAESDYALVILNKSRLTTDATTEIKQITKLLLEGLE